jgi:hypothetical protein
VDLSTYTRESAFNRQAYDQLREQIRRDYAGRYVAFAHGRVIDAASTFDAANELVDRLEVVPEYFLVFPANLEPDIDLIYDLAGSVGCSELSVVFRPERPVLSAQAAGLG